MYILTHFPISSILGFQYLFLLLLNHWISCFSVMPVSLIIFAFSSSLYNSGTGSRHGRKGLARENAEKDEIGGPHLS
jgi:hypothetical protein